MNGTSTTLMTYAILIGMDMVHIIHGHTVRGDIAMTLGSMDTARSIATHGTMDIIIMDSMIHSTMTLGMVSVTLGTITTMDGTTRSITTTIITTITTLHLLREMSITVHARMPGSLRLVWEESLQTEAVPLLRARGLQAPRGLKHPALHEAGLSVKAVRQQ